MALRDMGTLSMLAISMIASLALFRLSFDIFGLLTECLHLLFMTSFVCEEVITRSKFLAC